MRKFKRDRSQIIEMTSYPEKKTRGCPEEALVRDRAVGSLRCLDPGCREKGQERVRGSCAARRLRLARKRQSRSSARFPG